RNRRVPLQAGRRPGRRPPARGDDGEARQPLRQGSRCRARRRRGRLRGNVELRHPRRGGSTLSARLAVLSDVHGNLAALEAVRKAIKREKPDAVIVAGDHVMNGPDPAGVVDALRDMETSGATIVQGNTDVAVADFDYSAAFPWFTDGIPDTYVAAAELAHDALGDERLGGLRRLPSERRLMLDDAMVLACHASPGSQTQGFDTQLDPSVMLERKCAHKHPGISR